MEDNKIYFINRETGKKEAENVYGDFFLKLLYDNSFGRKLIPLFCRKGFSQFYGSLQNLSFSAKKIDKFIDKFSIKMEEFLPAEGHSVQKPYSNFNEFFIRKFKNGKRSFPSDAKKMGAFAEARYFGYQTVQDDLQIPVKGHYLLPSQLIEDEKWGKLFKDGSLLLARLCPVDYHRFHFPDNGSVEASWRRAGKLHSVNPLALKKFPEIFCCNERHITILKTENFGYLAYIEVGAMGVGKIIQNHQNSFNRGDEKGAFLFGGSTVIVIGEKGKWIPSHDLLQNSKNGIETYIKLGDVVAEK